MAELSFGGLASGLDTNAIIKSIIALESRPLQRLQARQQTLSYKQSTADSFRNKVKAFADAMGDLKDAKELQKFTGNSSDEDILRVSAEGDAQPGSYSVEVISLAESKSDAYNLGLPDSDTTTIGNAGTFDITVDGETETINVDATDTLEDIRNKINESDSGVRASIINDGTNFQLVVSSEDTGLANAYTLDNVTGFGGSSPFGSTTALNAAADASLKIDGLSVTSASNKVSEAVEGVTFELLQTTTSNIETSVGYDNSAIASRLEEVTNSYNEVMDFIAANDEDRDVALLSVRNQMQSLLFSDPYATTDPNDTNGFHFHYLAQIGIETSGGRLTVDRGQLDDAIEQDFDALLNFFSGDDNSGEPGVAEIFDRVLNGFEDTNGDFKEGVLSTNGTLAARKTSLESRMRDLDNRILQAQERLERSEQNMVRRFASFETLISQYQAQGASLGGF